MYTGIYINMHTIYIHISIFADIYLTIRGCSSLMGGEALAEALVGRADAGSVCKVVGAGESVCVSGSAECVVAVARGRG